MPMTQSPGLVDCEIPWSAQGYLPFLPGAADSVELGCRCPVDQPVARRAWLFAFDCPLHELVLA